MRNTIHTEVNQVLTYEKGINGDIALNKKYEVESTAFRLVNCRINPLSKQIEGIEGVNADKPVAVIRDGVKGVDLSAYMLKSITVGDSQVMVMAGDTSDKAQIAVYSAEGVITVVAANEQLGFLKGYKIDMATDGKNEVYICGPNTPNLFLSLSDMTYKVGTEDYFTKFDLNEHIPRVGAAMGVPIYVKHENVGSALGLKAGSYTYFIRLVDAEGNRTPWSQSTPLIPVAYQVNNRTVGAGANASTGFGLRIRFRVDGSAGFSYVEVGRMAYNTGQPIGFLPNMEVTKVVTDAYGNNVVLNSGAQVIDIVDTGLNQYTTVTDDESPTPSQVDHSNNVAYYDGRIIYSGIKYKRLDLSPSIHLIPTSAAPPELYPATTPNTYMFPFTENIGVAGHSDMWNQVYRKCETPGEYKNFGVVLWDGRGGRTPAIPLAVLKAYKMPNIREHIIPESVTLSVGTETVPMEGGGTGKTLDIYQYADGADLVSPPSTKYWGIKTIYPTTNPTYNPLHPVSSSDPIQENYRFTELGDGTRYRIPVANKYWRSIGNYLQGLDVSLLPEWVEAFSIVASDELGAVVAQGLATYKMSSDEDSLYAGTFTRDANNLSVYSPIFELSTDLLKDIVANPSSYKVQLTAPAAFIPEVAMNAITDATNGWSSADVLSRVTYNNTYGNASTDVTFSKWMNDTSTVTEQDTHVYDIINASINLTVSDSPNLNVQLSRNVYDPTINTVPAAGTTSREFWAPWYIVNIIRTGDFSIVSSNINTYKSIGNYQKINSTIGTTTGAYQELMLVDERVEDCINTYTKAYLKVGDKWWMCAARYEDEERAAVADIVAKGYHTVDGRDVYGLYTYRIAEHTTYVVFTTSWNEGLENVPAIATIPPAGQNVAVVYDSRKPIKLFSGNNYVGMASTNICNASQISTTTVKNQAASMQWHGRLIYNTFGLNTAYDYRPGLVRKNDSDYEQSTEVETIYRMRQWMALYPCISKVNIPLVHYGYPTINYVNIPFYSTSFNSFDNAFKDDFGELLTEVYGKVSGGFIKPKHNLDYMRVLSGLFVSLPAKGFTEVTYFPNRLIWSNRKQESAQDTPTNKTFLATSAYDLPSGSGENTFICAYNNLLTVFTERNIARIPINKYTLSNVDGSAMGVIQANRFIGEVNWMDAGIGIPKGRTATVAATLGSTMFLDKNADAYILSDKLTPVSTGFRWKLGTVPEEDVTGVGLGFYRNDMGEVWLPVSTGFIVYSLSYQSWYNVAFDTYAGFYVNKIPMMVGNGKAFIANGYSNLAKEPILHKAHFVAQPAPTSFKEFVWMQAYGTNINEIEVIGPNYRNVVGHTKEYLDVFKQRGNVKWAYFPSNENPPFNRCQSDFAILSVKGYANSEETGNFELTSLEVGAKKIR